MNKEKIIEEFKNEFGGEAWLGADRKQLITFWLSKLVQQKQEIKEMIEGMEKKIDKSLYADVQNRIMAQIGNVEKMNYNKALKDIIKKI